MKAGRILRNLWRLGAEFFPKAGFRFDCPVVLFQSDDWGRVGLRDKEGLEQFRAAGIALGEHPYDFYALETADDLSALAAMLKRHHDAKGRPPCIGMNFIVTNLKFGKMTENGSGPLDLLYLADGLPVAWSRPNLLEGYRSGIAEGVFRAALHGTTHFCRNAVERNFVKGTERGNLLRLFWQAGTPYIHWRMPWIGYEYWDPEQPDDKQFLARDAQKELIGQAVGGFAKLFSELPRSACAPGYRANDDTHRAWAQHGIRVAQNGPGTALTPHFDGNELLHVSRTVEFEPAVDPAFSVGACLQQAERCFARGLPAIVSVHSINFHSTVRDFRSRTLEALEEFLTALETRHPDLLYLHDEDLHELVSKGCYETGEGVVRANVKTKWFMKAAEARRPVG